jgi:putative membrane protein
MRHTRLVAALSMVLLAACAKGDETAYDSAGGTDTSAATSATAPKPPLTDANILGYLDELNAADSALGRIASTKGTHADVKAFGVLMMREHHAMRKAGQDLAAKLGVTPALPANDSLPMKVQKIADSLNVLAKGAPFDQGYIDDEIANHQAVLGFIDHALGVTQTAELKELLTNARPTVDMHLKRAQDIRARLGTGATQ